MTAMKRLGFDGLEEVAIGADLCAMEEAEEFMEHVPGKAALYGNLLLPGMVRHGQEAVPRLCAVHLHDHDPHGADGPAA